MHIIPAVPRQIPALCTNCGNVFNTRLGFSRNPSFVHDGRMFEIIGTGNEIISLGGQANCPSCNSIANFRCDLFDFVDDVFRDLRSLGKPEIIYLKELLKSYGETKRSKDDFTQMQQSAEQKGVKIFGKVVSENINEINALIALIAVMVSIVALAISGNEDEKPQSINIENIYTSVLDQPQNELPNYTSKILPKNQPCPCGSSKKFKHCCGKEYKLKK